MYDVYISSKYFKQPKEKILLAPIYIICLPRIKLLLSKLSMEWEKKFNTNSIPAINSKHFCFARNEASLNFATKFYFSFDIFFFFFFIHYSCSLETCSRLTNMIIVSRVSPTILSRSWGHSLTRRILTCTIWFCRPVVVSESVTTHRYNTN